MTIRGKNVDEFGDANFATLRTKRVDGQWEPASTNASWEVFWCEVTDYDGDTVKLAKFEERHEIQEDGRGEYVQIRQSNNGLFATGAYETRFRPFVEESRTETKPWMSVQQEVDEYV